MAHLVLGVARMKRFLLAPLVCGGCALYFGDDHTGGGGGSGSGSGTGTSPSHDLYRLVIDHAVGAERPIAGVDADPQGNLWIAYTTTGSYKLNQKPMVTLVHWNPTTRQSLATFTYSDEWSPVSGLALVHDQIWLNFKDVATPDPVIRVIDPVTGAIVRTLGTTGVELAAMGSDRVLVSAGGIQIIDAATGGDLARFASATVVDPTRMAITFANTQQGIAWRPGEIWVGNWYMPLEIYDEAGTLLGKIDFAAIRGEGASPMTHLAFDHDKLLVGREGQLTWFTITH